MFSSFCALVTTDHPETQLVFVLAGFAVCRNLFMLCVISEMIDLNACLFCCLITCKTCLATIWWHNKYQLDRNLVFPGVVCARITKQSLWHNQFRFGFGHWWWLG